MERRERVTTRSRAGGEEENATGDDATENRDCREWYIRVRELSIKPPSFLLIMPRSELIFSFFTTVLVPEL